MTTRSQERKAVAELVSGDFETSASGNNRPGNLIAGPSRSPRLHPEHLDETKTSLREELLTYLTKICALNQKKR